MGGQRRLHLLEARGVHLGEHHALTFGLHREDLAPRYLILPAEERDAVGATARASVQAHYTVRAMQDATLAVYAEVLADARAEPDL